MRLPLVVAGAAAAAAAVQRVRRMAEEEGRPVSEILADLPERLRKDLASLPDDLRAALDDARDAGERREHALDRELDEAAAAGEA